MEQLKSILIIDDEPLLRELLHRQLREAGYRAIEAGDAEEALNILRKDLFIDLVILDIALPKLSGLDFFDLMRRDFPKTKIIVSSVYSPEEQEFFIAGADAYYYKSESFPTLLIKVDDLLKAQTQVI